MLTLEQQTIYLQQVSRTFALTIPLLPAPLNDWVGNAYLLCRIVDTIEDDADLSCQDKQSHLAKFLSVFSDPLLATDFVVHLLPVISSKTPAHERALLVDTPAVLARCHSYPVKVQNILKKAVTIMSRGMLEQQGKVVTGQQDLDRYCYVVAGVVGELLTQLFAEYSPEIKRRRENMLPLSVSFGLGLQLTNILKDVGEDRARGVCWLPSEVLSEFGLSAENLASAPAAKQALMMNHFVALARGHLADALEFTLQLPPHEQGLRQFCLWAIAMALLTLQRIVATPGFSSGQQVKIKRRQVHTLILICRILGKQDRLLRCYFSWLGRWLPNEARDPHAVWRTVSCWQ